MADEPTTDAAPEADDLPYDEKDAGEEPSKPEPKETKPTEPEPPDEEPEDEDEDDEYTTVTLDIPPEKIEKKPEEKKEEKADGAKAEDTGKTEAEAASKAPSAPPKLVKRKIGEDEYEVPEKFAETWDGVVEKAREIQENTKKLHGNLLGGFDEKAPKPGQFSATALDLLTEQFGGDREKAYNALLDEYATVIKREIEFRELPEDRRARILAEEKAARLEAQLKAQREADERDAEKKREAEHLNKCAGAVIGSMREQGFALSKENRPVYDKALNDILLVASQKKGITPMEIAAIVKNAKAEVEADAAQREAESKRRIAEAATLPDDQFGKFAETHRDLIDRVRKWDTAKLKEERAAKKATAAKPEPERKTTPPKREVLDSAGWAARFG